jgi:hypothetical protein
MKSISRVDKAPRAGFHTIWTCQAPSTLRRGHCIEREPWDKPRGTCPVSVGECEPARQGGVCSESGKDILSRAQEIEKHFGSPKRLDSRGCKSDKEAVSSGIQPANCTCSRSILPLNSRESDPQPPTSELCTIQEVIPSVRPVSLRKRNLGEEIFEPRRNQNETDEPEI